VKHLLVSLGVLSLVRWSSTHRLARAGLMTAVPVYSILICYHISMTVQFLQ
jgi:hypothetical protein